MEQKGVSNRSKSFNVQLCGNSSVGKTSLIHRLIYDNYLECPAITLGVNYYKKEFVIQNEQVSVMIHDTSGQERYMDITKQSVRKADAIILVYDKTNQESFQDLQKNWMSSFRQVINLESTALMLIGNKQDQLNEVVSYDQADQLARQYNMMFFETSARSGLNVCEAFNSFVQKLYLMKKQLLKSTATPISSHPSLSQSQQRRMSDPKGKKGCAC